MPWKPGESGNPLGKRAGTRDKVTAAFLTKLDTAWRKYGTEAMEKTARERPADFCKLVASLLPRDQNLKVEDASNNPFLKVLTAMNGAASLEAEIARLKEENAALKGEPIEDKPGDKLSGEAVH